MNRIFTLSISLILLGSCTEAGNSFTNEITFLVQPQCEEEVRNYLSSFDGLDQFATELIEVQSSDGPYSEIKYVARIFSRFDDPSEDMSPYLNGAMEECGTNSVMSFSTENHQEMANFVEIMPFLKDRNGDSPLIIELVDDALLVHEIYSM